VQTGPTELLSQFRLFDKEKKGWITSEEFVKGCAMFNLYPSADVLAEIVSRYFDEQGRISFAVFVTSIIDTFDFPKARLGDAACSSLLAGNLVSDASTNLWTMVRDAGPVDALPKEELVELCLGESSNMPIAGDDLLQLLNSCPTDDEGKIGLRSFGSAVASTLLVSGRTDAKDQVWELLNATGLPGMGLPWSHGIDANRAFDTSIQTPSSEAAAAALFKAGENSDEEPAEHPVEDPGTLQTWGSLDTVEPIQKSGMPVLPTQVMADKMAQKTVGPNQYSDLPKMYNKFAHHESMTKDEFAAFLQEGLNTNLGKDDVDELVNKLGAGQEGSIDFREISALAHPSDYPKTDGKYKGVLTLTHPSDAMAQKPAAWEPRAPDGLTTYAPIDPVFGLVNKAKQKSEGAKSAEGAELQALIAAFKHFDVANSGTLTAEQIGQVLDRLSLPASQTSRLLDMLGENDREAIDYRSLCKKVCVPSQENS
jgi:Ca2+-binding EF-hand superfamily protein